ncbi:MAG: protein tyrosine kinase, partial [Actinobacteria bacterium]|nr:protein tyrosine kinase [Actinomycetota bacterium]
MTLQDFVRVLRKRWVSITLITLLAILGATGASLLAPNVYQAQTQTFVAITSQDSGAG